MKLQTFTNIINNCIQSPTMDSMESNKLYNPPSAYPTFFRCSFDNPTGQTPKNKRKHVERIPDINEATKIFRSNQVPTIRQNISQISRQNLPFEAGARKAIRSFAISRFCHGSTRLLEQTATVVNNGSEME